MSLETCKQLSRKKYMSGIPALSLVGCGGLWGRQMLLIEKEDEEHEGACWNHGTPAIIIMYEETIPPTPSYTRPSLPL